MAMKPHAAERLPQAHGVDKADIDSVFAVPTARGHRPVPIHLVTSFDVPPKDFTPAQTAWLKQQTAAGQRVVLIPDPQGAVAAVVAKVAPANPRDPMARPELTLGALAPILPSGKYTLETVVDDPALAALAWGLGQYAFARYRSKPAASNTRPQLVVPPSIDLTRIKAELEGVWLGRDLINTPASDMSPAQLESEARAVAERHGAAVSSIVGHDLIAARFPMIHAVGRAALEAPGRAPRLVDLRWSPRAPTKGIRPKITLVGKGITFDTGGLDIKPASAMLLMKKDMGGAATALAAAHIIMALQLDVELRVILAIAENAIAGDAFRPGDVLATRAGPTVEIGNTDAEGRLVLGDALALADEEDPDLLVTFATLTGAARSALGPDLPPFYTDDPDLAQAIDRHGRAVCDPVWQLPLWPGYEPMLESSIADMNNSPESPFAGSITAALFLKRFVKNARRFAHFDIYGWRPQAKALGPKGGEPQVARAIVRLIESLARDAHGTR